MPECIKKMTDGDHQESEENIGIKELSGEEPVCPPKIVRLPSH